MKLEERMPQRIQLQEGSIVLLADISELGSPHRFLEPSKYYWTEVS